MIEPAADALDVDRLLRNFYQEEQPRSWPPCPTPAAPPQPLFRASSFRSRAALAASIGILLFTGLWVHRAVRNTDVVTPADNVGTLKASRPTVGTQRSPRRAIVRPSASSGPSFQKR